MSEVGQSVTKPHPFFKSLRPDDVAKLTAIGSEVEFQAGELIFREGDQSSFFYLLISGNVALEVVPPGHPVRVATLVAGDVLGWSSVTGVTDKQFRARALETVHALAFDGARLRYACESDFAFGFFFMRAILAVLAERLHSIRAQLLDAYTPVGIGNEHRAH